jgi:catechol 2,3-dioxygenase-like lactoylglutathione lyase family enzyme
MVMKITAANVTINVKELDRSIDFYRSIGFELKNRWGNFYAQLSAPGITIGLHPSATEHGPLPGAISIGFTTDDFEGAKTLLDKLSVPNQFRKEEGGQFIHFDDPDGTPLYFVSPKTNDK